MTKLVKPEYDFEALKKFSTSYRRKASIMKEICSERHENILYWEGVRNLIMTLASVVIISLTFFGTDDLNGVLGMTGKVWGVIFSSASLVLVLASVWTLVRNKSQLAFVHYRGVQSFSTLVNTIDFVSGASGMSDERASEAAGEIFNLYNEASLDIPRIGDDEHKRARSRVDK